MAERITVNSRKPLSTKENLISQKRKTNFRSNSSPFNRILYLQRTIGNQAVQRMVRSGALQAKLRIGQHGDVYEQEADRVADAVMRMPEPGVRRQLEEEEMLQAKPLAEEITPLVQRQAEPEEEEEEMLQAKNSEDATPEVTNDLESQINAIHGGGRPLAESERAYFEPRFGHDFSQVRMHTDALAAESARAINAQAFTMGQDVVFGAGQYAPESSTGQRLMAHELTHVIQQGGAAMNRGLLHTLSLAGGSHIQRTLGDGHDLTSPRFSRLLDLEAAYDDEILIKKRSSGRGVQAIQQALYDLGHTTPAYGADGKFGRETKAAVMAYQRANPPLAIDGKVGKNTMAALDTRFGVPTLPTSSVRSARWTGACVRSVLCPWSPHTINVLSTRITLKSFDSISWADEKWNGSAWVPAPFPGGGYNTGVEIGVLNNSCESMSETLYHEVLHAEQPTTHRTTMEKESYAYRIGEEFSIAMGLGGRPTLRSTDVQGREYADPAKVGASVANTYPSVPTGGGGDEIIGKAATFGHVRVQRPNGSIYTRAAAVNEKVPGPMTVVNGVTHPTSGWACP